MCIRDRPNFDLEPANPGGDLECRIDQEDWEPCSSSFTPEINNGEHVLYVRGDDSTDEQSGVADRLFYVEVDHPPNTTISAGPTYTWDFMNPDEYRRPAFSFVSSDSTGHLECSFDGEPFAPCDDPGADGDVSGSDRPDEPLSYGDHSFEVRAVDGAGNEDPSPAHKNFTVSPYDGELELELSEPGIPSSLRKLASSGLSPIVRCSKSCQVDAKATLRWKAKRGFRTIHLGRASGDAGLDATAIKVSSSSRAQRVLRKAKRASVRIELTASPSDGNGNQRKLTRIQRIKNR